MTDQPTLDGQKRQLRKEIREAARAGDQDRVDVLIDQLQKLRERNG